MTKVLNAPLLTFGLRKKPTYEEVINYIENDKDKIQYPDRKAKFLRNTFELSQLDGLGMQIMEEQQLREIKEREKIHYLREIANNSDRSYKFLTAQHDEQKQKPLSGPPAVHDMTATDDDGEFMTPRRTVAPEIPEAPYEALMSSASSSSPPTQQTMQSPRSHMRTETEGFNDRDWKAAELRAIAEEHNVRVRSNESKESMYKKMMAAGINPHDYTSK
jgi:hypothetical protein